MKISGAKIDLVAQLAKRRDGALVRNDDMGGQPILFPLAMIAPRRPCYVIGPRLKIRVVSMGRLRTATSATWVDVRTPAAFYQLRNTFRRIATTPAMMMP